MNQFRRRSSLAALAFLPLSLVGGCQGGCSDTTYMPTVEKAPGQVVILDKPALTVEHDPEDERYSVGWWPKLARDNQDKIHLIYCDAEMADLDYALYDGSSWRLETIVSKDVVGKYPALAVDSKGYPHVTFYDQKSRYYNYARQDQEGWHFERLIWGQEMGVGASMVLDKDDLPHLIFYSLNGHLVYMHRRTPLTGPVGTASEPDYQSQDREAWQEMSVGNFGGGFSAMTDLQFGPDGRLWASFVNSQLVKSGFYVGQFDGSSWQTTNLADREAPGWSSRIIFDQSGPLILYGSLLKERLYLTRPLPDGTFAAEVYGLRMGGMTAELDKNGVLWVAHQYLQPGSTGFGQMRLLRKEGRQLHWYAIDDNRDSGQYLDMVLDKNDRPVIAYYDPVTHALKVYMESQHE